MSVVVSQLQSNLSVCLLGPLDIRIDGKRVGPIRSRKEQWLIALLVLRNDRYVTREWLAETLWPDNTITQSLSYLRRTIYLLRRTLGTEAHQLCGDGSRTLRLSLAGASIDLLEYDAAIKRGRPEDLKRAVDLYRGPLLEGCDEEWVMADRQVREQSYITALEGLAAHERTAGNIPAEIDCLRRLILRDPFRESAHRALMQAYSDDGNHSAMITAYRDLRLMLRRELNADPDPSTCALYDALRSEPPPQGQTRISQAIVAVVDRPPSGGMQSAPTASRRDAKPPRRPLPRPLTRLIGREQDLIDVSNAISASRLVTLTGAGGVGKTRLAIEVATAVEGKFRDGVCYVDLSGLTDSHLVAQTISIALGCANSTDPSATNTVTDYLRGKHLLLLMDGCEHLIEASAWIAGALLAECPGVKILATSQQPIGLSGETVWRTPTLSLPAPQSEPAAPMSVDEVSSYAGIALFVERATTRRADFLLSDRNMGAVVQICSRLDGIPLAIELAAARLTVLSVEQISSKLDDRFRLLTSGSRTAIPRHQTLRAALDWSYDLLGNTEQRMLQRLSVFWGGATLEAVEALCAEDIELGPMTLDVVQQLVDKSFVWTASMAGAMRYRLPETTREYALEKLQSSGAMEAVKKSHSAVYHDQLKEARSSLSGHNARRGLDVMDAEGDNVRAMLEWLIRPEATSDEILQCQVIVTSLLFSLWQGRSHFGEARYWLERVLDRDSKHTRERANLEFCAGYVAMRQGMLEAAEHHIQAGLTTFRTLGDQSGISRGLNDLGKLAELSGDYQQARELLIESLAGYQSLGDDTGIRAVTNNLGNAAMMAGDFAAARFYHQQCLDYAKRAGAVVAAAWSLDNLAEVALAEGDLISARRLFRESLAAFVQNDYRPGAADCVQGLGESACAALDDAAGACAAARLFGAAERMREVSGLAIMPADLPLFERAVQLGRRALTDVEFDSEWAIGRALSYDDAIKFASEYKEFE